jgi:hypothetical protein
VRSELQDGRLPMHDGRRRLERPHLRMSTLASSGARRRGERKARHRRSLRVPRRAPAITPATYRPRARSRCLAPDRVRRRRMPIRNADCERASSSRACE